MRGSRSWIFMFSMLIAFPMSGSGKPIESLVELQRTLSAHTVIRGSFKQTRTLELFDQPLVSEGRFLLSEPHGLQWLQTHPFSVTLILGKDQLSQQFGEQPAQVMQADENPMMFYFSGLFLSIFRGETEGLAEQFNVEFFPPVKEEKYWTLKLTPEQGPLKTAFKTIRLQGREYIDTIRLEETSGDISVIQFSHQSNHPASLTEAERSSFEF